MHPAFDRNRSRGQSLLPALQLPGFDGKAEMELARAAVAGNGAAGSARRCLRCAFAKQKQNLCTGNAQSAHPAILKKYWKAKQFRIEAGRAFEILDVKRGLQHMRDAWPLSWHQTSFSRTSFCFFRSGGVRFFRHQTCG